MSASPASLVSVDEALARLLDGVTILPAETASFAAALGRILAADVVATLTQPPFAASAMDGYAIRWADRAGPWRLIGESAAGRRFSSEVESGRNGRGEAVRILTGAPLPAGADTVVVQEDVARDGNAITLTGDGPPCEGAHIRRAGLDFAAGDVVARAGDRVTPARIGVAAAAGHAALPVRRRPRVAIIATGDELVPPGTTPGPDAIVSSNGVMLAALLGAYADVIDGGIVADDPATLAVAIRTYVGTATTADTSTTSDDASFASAGGRIDTGNAEILVTIGGASVGDHDHVLPVLRSLGAEIDFWRIALRPGKPMLAGRLGATRVIGLPGNPVSAFVCATLFVVPLLRRLAGEASPVPATAKATTGMALPANGPRRDYLRARLENGVVTPASIQDSAMLAALAASNVLIIREAGASELAAGAIVDCIVLDTISGVA